MIADWENHNPKLTTASFTRNVIMLYKSLNILKVEYYPEHQSIQMPP